MKLLDDLYRMYLDEPCEVYDLYMDDNSLTLAMSDEDVIQLNPSSGYHKQLKNEIETDYDIGIVKYIIGSQVAQKLSRNVLFGYYFLGQLKALMLKKMLNKFDLKNVEVLTFSRIDGSIFREIGDGAGIEIRLYCRKKKDT